RKSAGATARFAEASARLHPGDGQRRVTRVAQRNVLGEARGTHELAREAQTSGRHAQHGTDTDATQGDHLRASGGVVGYDKHGGPRAAGARTKGDVYSAVGSGRNAGPAIIALGEVAAVRAGDRHAADTQRLVAGVGKCHGLGRTRSPHELIRKAEAAWREGGDPTYSCPAQSNRLRTVERVVAD